MNDDPVSTITLHILDKPYQVKCTKSCTKDLQEAAFYLDEKMREINEIGSLKSLDHIILMAALNITNEFLHDNARARIDEPNIVQKVQSLQRKLTGTLTANSGESPL